MDKRHSGSKGEKWYELRRCAYYDEFEKDKIIYIYTAKEHKFAFDTSKSYLKNNCYFIRSSDRYLLAFLNSKLFKLYIINNFAAFGDARLKGRCRLDYNKMLVVPIRVIDEKTSKKITISVNEIIELKKDFYSKKNNFLNFLKSDLEISKFSEKLKVFWLIESTDFLKEIHKGKKDLTTKQRKELYELFGDALNQIKPLLFQIKQKKEFLNNLIYEIYGITPQEQEYIEDFLS